jgi:hypothetical protein
VTLDMSSNLNGNSLRSQWTLFKSLVYFQEMMERPKKFFTFSQNEFTNCKMLIIFVLIIANNKHLLPGTIIFYTCDSFYVGVMVNLDYQFDWIERHSWDEYSTFLGIPVKVFIS